MSKETLDTWVTVLSLDRDTVALSFDILKARTDTWLYERHTPLSYWDAVALEDALANGILAGSEPGTGDLMRAYQSWRSATTTAENNQRAYLTSAARRAALATRRGAGRGGA